MYDTVNFSITKNEVKDTDFMEKTSTYITNPCIHNWNNGEKSISGNINGYKVSISRFQVKVKDGSLCKWSLGNNFEVMSRQDTKHAIEKLSDTLHLPMSKSKITRVDVAQNFIMEQPIENYLNHLGELKYCKRIPIIGSNGLYYYRNGNIYCLYDKIKEQKNRCNPIPEMFQNKNVLRIEQRYMKRITNQFNVPSVTANMLYDEIFYTSTIDKWYNTYKAIQKVNDIQLNVDKMKTKKDLYKIGTATLVKDYGGEINFTEMLKEGLKRNDLTRNQYYNLKQKINESLHSNIVLSVSNKAIKELDQKMDSIIKNTR